MRKNPARMAWAVLLTAFAIFCTLAISIPLTIRWYLLNAQSDLPATLRVTAGTVLLVDRDTEDPIAVVDTRAVRSSTEIQTDQSAQATLVFSASSAPDSPEIATVQIYPGAQVNVREASRPRFRLSDAADRIVVDVRSGRVRINTANPQPRGLHTEVRTPQADLVLAPGSYAVDVANDQTLVATRLGEAVVEAAGTTLTVTEGMHTQVAIDQPPSEPLPGPENLIANGDFAEPLGPPTWLISNYPEQDPTAGTVSLVTQGGRSAARFSRLNQPPTHTEVAITQVLDRSVHDYENLNLQLDVLLRWQSLPGAGEQSSEFPLMIRLDYDDIYGNHQFWVHGFYYRDPPPQWVVTRGQKIPQNVWFPFDSGNLFDRLQEEGLPPPAKLNYLRLYASGHNYDSLATEVRLVAQ